MKRYIIERDVVVTEVTDVEAESPEAALAEVRAWPNGKGAWDRIDCEYGHAYVADEEDI